MRPTTVLFSQIFVLFQGPRVRLWCRRSTSVRLCWRQGRRLMPWTSGTGRLYITVSAVTLGMPTPAPPWRNSFWRIKPISSWSVIWADYRYITLSIKWICKHIFVSDSKFFSQKENELHNTWGKGFFVFWLYVSISWLYLFITGKTFRVNYWFFFSNYVIFSII